MYYTTGGIMSQHHFDVEFAETYGIEGAVLLNHIDFWLSTNINNQDKIVFKDNRYWVYFIPDNVEKHFPYMKVVKFRRVMNTLVDSGVLLKNQFGGIRRNNYYTFSDEFLVSNPKKLLSLQSYERTNIDLPMDKFGDCTHDSNIYNTLSKDNDATFQLPKKRYSLSDELKKYIPVIEYWNSKRTEENKITRTQLPENIEEGVSKTVFAILDIINDITTGKFYTKNRFGENKLFNYDKPIPLEEIYNGIDFLIEQYRPDRLPKDKSTLSSKLKDFLYVDLGPGKRSSPFFKYYFAYLDKHLTLYNPPKDIRDKYLNILGSNLSNQDKLSLDKMLDKLYNSYMNNKYLCKVYPKYSSYLGSERAFFTTHFNYIKTFYSNWEDINIGILNTSGKVWERFKAWLQDEFDIKIDLKEYEERLLKKRVREEMIKRGKAVSEDFDKDNNYIGGIYDFKSRD